MFLWEVREGLTKCFQDELMVGLIAEAEQTKELGPSEDENLGQMMVYGLRSTQVRLNFDLIHIWPDLTYFSS